MLEEEKKDNGGKVHSQFYLSFVSTLSGSLGGAATVAVGQPLDTVKVKMQAFPETYPNSFKCFVSTLKNEGFFRGLYAGTTPSLAANVAENAFLFCARDYCQELISMRTGRYGDERTILDHATAGFFGGFFSGLVLCPTELIKCKLQAIREMNAKPISATALTISIFKEGGIRGLFRGLASTIAREMPGYFFFFGGIESTKVLLAKHTSIKKESPLVPLISGGVGGMCLWLTIFPFDLVKSRLQIENSKSNFTQMLFKIYREEGFRTLYRGLTPTLVRTFPATAALLYTVETTKSMLL